MAELGFYSPGVSYLHRAHAATKIIVFAVAITALPLLLGHWLTQLMLAMALAAIIWSAGVRRRQVLYFSPAAGLIVIAAASWLLTDLGGPVVLEMRAGPLMYVLREHTLDQALAMSLRALIWVLAYMALLTTTSSRELVAGLERLGLPYRAARAVGMTLKFWANVLADTRCVMDAQRLRGVDFDRGPRLRQLKQRFVVATVPTIFLMLKRFRMLSFALALRAFGAPGRKTRVYAPPLTALDAQFMAAAAGALVLLGLVDRWVAPL